jgi:hypothetical protein
MITHPSYKPRIQDAATRLINTVFHKPAQFSLPIHESSPPHNPSHSCSCYLHLATFKTNHKFHFCFMPLSLSPLLTNPWPSRGTWNLTTTTTKHEVLSQFYLPGPLVNLNRERVLHSGAHMPLQGSDLSNDKSIWILAQEWLGRLQPGG